MAGAMSTMMGASLFAESSDDARRELNAPLRLSFLRNSPSSEASNASLFLAVSEMILFRRGIDFHILSSVRVIFSKCSLIMSRSASNNWLPIPISQCKSGTM